MGNLCPAELFQLYFLSFEAGIANIISSFKWRKIWLRYLWKITSVNISISINWAALTNYFIDFSGILFPLKIIWNQIYKDQAAQRLTVH